MAGRGGGRSERKAERCDHTGRKVEQRDVWKRRCKLGRVTRGWKGRWEEWGKARGAGEGVRVADDFL